MSTTRDGSPQSPLIPEHIQRTRGYLDLSYVAHQLLKELAWQRYTGTANGDLVASWTHMQRKGMPSSGTLQRCLCELLAAGLLVVTEPRRGRRAQRYALTWQPYGDPRSQDGDTNASAIDDATRDPVPCR